MSNFTASNQNIQTDPGSQGTDVHNHVPNAANDVSPASNLLRDLAITLTHIKCSMRGISFETTIMSDVELICDRLNPTTKLPTLI